MLDLKTIHSVLGEFEDRGISRETMLEAIESAMATAYKKEYGKRGQVVRAKLDMNSGGVTFEQVKTIVDDTMVRFERRRKKRLRTNWTAPEPISRTKLKKRPLKASSPALTREAYPS
jgi:hypothetical protein